jgi:hypothetical protein
MDGMKDLAGGHDHVMAGAVPAEEPEPRMGATGLRFQGGSISGGDFG